MPKKHVTKKTASKKATTKKQSKILGYGYTIEHDFIIITGGGLAVILLAVVVF